MPGEISSERPPERCRKVKKNLRDSMLSLGLVKWLKASVQEAPQVSKDGESQKQGTVAQGVTRARASEVVGDSSRTGGVGHAGVVLSGTYAPLTLFRRGLLAMTSLPASYAISGFLLSCSPRDFRTPPGARRMICGITSSAGYQPSSPPHHSPAAARWNPSFMRFVNVARATPRSPRITCRLL